MTPREVLALCREREIRAVDLRFMDFPGTQKHFTVPVGQLTEASFEDGFGFDGSSLRGWQAINESDLLVVPQAETAFVDPFGDSTLVLTGNIADPVTREDYAKDPRNVARKAERYMLSTGLADRALFGAEVEFFVFDSAAFRSGPRAASYELTSGEAGPGELALDDTAHRIPAGGGYFAMPPADSLQKFRNDAMLLLEECGVPVLAHHHETAGGGQCEIDLAASPLVATADAVLRSKYIIKNLAARYGKSATFMPKPVYGDNGSGTHLHLSLWRNDEPLFAGSGYGGLSETAMFAIGGILKHAPALFAFCCPTTNSYKRLVPGFEAPVNLTYSHRNRSAAIRIPANDVDPASKRFEFRAPDSSANPYLATAATLMAALDGIRSQTEPGPPLDKDLYDLEPAELVDVPKVPGSLEEALAALRADHDFLLRGDVFTEDVIDTWIWYKTEHEADAVRGRPHPHEFGLYYDV